jgi:hypothetical protein
MRDSIRSTIRLWTCLTLAALTWPVTHAAVPAPMARWTFDGDARDRVGSLHGSVFGDATITEGRLVLRGNGGVITTPLDRTLTTKTLWARVRIDPLEQGGGGVLTVENSTGNVFDSIVYGERRPGEWIAGSDFFNRTRDLDGVPRETSTNAWIDMAIVYLPNGTLSLYRNGIPYGPSYWPTTAPATYFPFDAHLLMGIRHSNGFQPYLRGEIEEAALFDRALNSDEVAQLSSGRSDVVTSRIWNGDFEAASGEPWQVSGLGAEGVLQAVPSSFVQPRNAAQGLRSFSPTNGSPPVWLQQAISAPTNQPMALSFAVQVPADATGFLQIVADGQPLEPLALAGASLPADPNGGRSNWLYLSRVFTASQTNISIRFGFPATTSGVVRLDDIRTTPATNASPRPALEWPTKPVFVPEWSPTEILVRRVGELGIRAHATLEIVSDGSTNVPAGGIVFFPGVPVPDRIGLVFEPGQMEARVGLAVRPGSPVMSSTNRLALRLRQTGNATVPPADLAIAVVPFPALGRGLEFDGIDQMVAIPHGPELNPYPMTLSLWLQTTQMNSFAGLVGNYVSGSGNGWSVHLNDGRIHGYYFRDWSQYVWGGDSALDAPDGGFVADGVWHHIAYVLDASGARIFVDGVQRGSRGWNGFPGAPTQAGTVTLGNAPLLPDGTGTAHFRGRLDEVRVLPVALDATQVRDLMGQVGSEGIHPSVLRFDFDQPDPVRLTNRAPTGSRFDGVLRGTLPPRFVDLADTTTAPEPIVRNGGFEAPTLSPWIVTLQGETNPVSTEPMRSLAHSAQGVRNLQVPSGSTGFRVAQRIRVEPGVEYRLTFAHALTRNLAGSLGIEIDGVPLEPVPVAGPILAPWIAPVGGSWNYTTRMFRSPAEEVELALVVPALLGGSLHFDDVRVVPASTPVADGTIEVLPAEASVLEGYQVELTFRRTGGLENRGHAVVQLLAGTASVGSSGVLRLVEDPSTDRFGIVFAPGQSEARLTVSAQADLVSQPPRTASVGVLPTGNLRVVGSPAAITLRDRPIQVTAHQTSPASERDGAVRLTLAGGTGEARIRVETVSGGTATPGEDYTPISLELTLRPQAFTNVSIPLMRDARIEGNETIRLRLTPLSENTVIADPEPVLVFQDESAVVISLQGLGDVDEASGAARFLVVRTGEVDNPQRFHVRYEAGGFPVAMDSSGNEAAPARPGIDFVATSGEVEFGPGITNVVIEVPLLRDTEADGHRGLQLGLFGTREFPAESGIGFAQGLVLIRDDEPSQILQEVAVLPFLGRFGNASSRIVSIPGGGALVLSGSIVWRLTESGQPDLGFGGGTGRIQIEPFAIPGGFLDLDTTIRFLPDGRFVFVEYSGRVARWNRDGSPDRSLGSGSGTVWLGQTFRSLSGVGPDGSLVWLETDVDALDFRLRRTLPDGSADTGFVRLSLGTDGENVRTWTTTNGVTWWLRSDGDGVAWLRRLLADGTLDSGFEPMPDVAGFLGTDAAGRSYFRLAWIDSGEPGDLELGGVVRFLADGTQDRDYRPMAQGGQVLSGEVWNDGSVLVMFEAPSGQREVREFGVSGVLLRRFPIPETHSVGQLTAWRLGRETIVLHSVRTGCNPGGPWGWGGGCWQIETQHWLQGDSGWRIPTSSLLAPTTLGSPDEAGWMIVHPGEATEEIPDAATTRIFRTFGSATSSRWGFPKSMVFSAGEQASIPVVREGGSTGAGVIRGTLTPWNAGRWDERRTLPFEQAFAADVGRIELRLTLPVWTNTPVVREYLVRLEESTGAGVGPMRECRIWNVEASTLPDSGRFRLLSAHSSDSGLVKWLGVTPRTAGGGPGFIERRPSLSSGPTEAMDAEVSVYVELGTTLLIPLPVEQDPTSFYRIRF